MIELVSPVLAALLIYIKDHPKSSWRGYKKSRLTFLLTNTHIKFQRNSNADVFDYEHVFQMDLMYYLSILAKFGNVFLVSLCPN